MQTMHSFKEVLAQKAKRSEVLAQKAKRSHATQKSGIVRISSADTWVRPGFTQNEIKQAQVDACWEEYNRGFMSPEDVDDQIRLQRAEDKRRRKAALEKKQRKERRRILTILLASRRAVTKAKKAYGRTGKGRGGRALWTLHCAEQWNEQMETRFESLIKKEAAQTGNFYKISA